MNKFRSAAMTGVLALGVLGFGGAAVAETESQTLFKHKHWEVEIVGYDDGTLACLAEVDAISESFTIWTFQDGSVRLQFYSTSWDFGDTGDTADLRIQIDRRRDWTLNDADLYKNSVLFNLPDSDAGVRLLVEVAQGSRLYLRSDDGSNVQNYSLAGSRASMDALIECGNVIKSNSNPFK